MSDTPRTDELRDKLRSYEREWMSPDQKLDECLGHAEAIERELGERAAGLLSALERLMVETAKFDRDTGLMRAELHETRNAVFAACGHLPGISNAEFVGILKAEHDAWKACAYDLAGALRCELRGDDLREASGQKAHATALAMFEKLKGTQ